jgi:CRP-like cAMP-binding protein
MNIEHSSLINYFRKRNKLDSEEIEFLNKIFEIKTYDSKEILLKKGDVCKNIYFIEEGVVKTYFIDEDEKEFINGIAIENNFCTSVASFINQIPSTEEIISLENTKVLAINFVNYKIFIDKYPIYKDLYIKILEDYLTFMTWRIESISLMSAQDRYITLMKIFPKLFLRVSNYDMSKYLGMSPETLSRTKSKK